MNLILLIFTVSLVLACPKDDYDCFAKKVRTGCANNTTKFSFPSSDMTPNFLKGKAYSIALKPFDDTYCLSLTKMPEVKKEQVKTFFQDLYKKSGSKVKLTDQMINEFLRSYKTSLCLNQKKSLLTFAESKGAKQVTSMNEPCLNSGEDKCYKKYSLATGCQYTECKNGFQFFKCSDGSRCTINPVTAYNTSDGWKVTLSCEKGSVASEMSM